MVMAGELKRERKTRKEGRGCGGFMIWGRGGGRSISSNSDFSRTSSLSIHSNAREVRLTQSALCHNFDTGNHSPTVELWA